MKKGRAVFFKLGAVLLLVAIGAVMMIVGRGHTVYFDNKKLEYNGQTYECPYKTVVIVKDEKVAKLYAEERGMATHIGQSFEMTLEITQEKGGEESVSSYSLKLPYSMDGVIINLPGFLAGLPEEAYISEFVPIVPETSGDEEEVPIIDEFAIPDEGDEPAAE